MWSLQNPLEPGVLEDLLKVLTSLSFSGFQVLIPPRSPDSSQTGRRESEALVSHHSFELFTIKFERTLENKIEHPPFHRLRKLRGCVA